MSVKVGLVVFVDYFASQDRRCILLDGKYLEHNLPYCFLLSSFMNGSTSI